MVTVAIHEFSTGINPERLPGGGWRSRGFKVGKYMNSTLENIPNSVERAIANKWFEVSQDRNSQEPTFIGRVVEPDWSVVAVVTPGQDEYGRSTSLHRYFLCEGADSLWKIIAWMDERQQSGNQIVFDPFATQQPGHPHWYDVPDKQKLPLPWEWQTFLSDNQPPVIVEPGRVPNLQTINTMAEGKANGGAVSWAYNVEVIEHPELFTIVQAANEQSYQSLVQRRQYPVDTAGAMVLSGDRAAMVLSGDRAAIETAIKGLTSGSQTRREEWIQNLVNTLNRGKVDREYWEAIFDGQGAANAIRQGNSNTQMVRLLTLRAFVLPETLPEFLEWLKIEDKQKQETPQQKVSLEFQSQLKNKLNERRDNFLYGIENALDALLRKKLSVAAVLWLLTSPGSIWAPYRRQIIENVRTDLIAINNSFNSNRKPPEAQTFRCGEKLWVDLCKCWQRRYRSSTYKPLAELFTRLKKYELADDLSAYFYQVSDGAVPTAIFKQAQPQRSDEGNILGLTVKRKIPLPEQGVRFLKKYAKIIAIVSLLASTHFTTYLAGFKQGQNQGWANSISPWKRRAIDNFSTTMNAIENIVTELTPLIYKTPQGEERDRIITALQQTLIQNNSMRSEDLNYQKAISANWWELDWQGEIRTAREKWVEAIYSYQRNQPKLVADGYIEPGKRTYDLLRCDVADSLGINLQPRPQICDRGMTDIKIQRAKREFIPRTKGALEMIVKELGENQALGNVKYRQEYVKIVTAIKSILPIEGNLDYSSAVQKVDPKQIEILVKAIFYYQQQNGLAADGIINLNKNTYKKLKEDVKAKLISKGQ